MRFVRQILTIRVTNFDDRLMSEKKIRKYGNMLPISIRGIICGPSNCGKTNVLISLLESLHGVRFENVYIYSKSLQQPKYQYLKNLFAPIEEIGYFTFTLITVTSYHRVRRFRIPSLSLMAWRATSKTR